MITTADEEIKTLAVKLALEDGTFQQGMRNLKQQLGVTSSEFDAAGGKVKGFGNTLDGVKANAQALGDKIKTMQEIESQYKAKLQETQATLQKQAETMAKNKETMEQAKAAYDNNIQAVSDLKERVNTLSTAYKESVEQSGKDSEATKNLKEQLNQAKQAYATANESIGKNSKATTVLKTNLDEQTDAFKRSEAQVAKTQKSLNGYTIQMNKATGEIKKMESELANNNGFAVVSKNLEDAGKKAEAAGKKISSVGQSWTFGVSLPIAAAGAACVKMATDFETSSAKVSTIADSSVMSMDKMKQGALNLSTSTHDDVNDINQSLYQAMSAGIKTGDSLKFVGDAVKLAKGGFTDTATAVNTLTSVLNAYHMKASAANSISDQLIKTQDLGKTTVGELGQSLGQVIPIAASLNVKTQDLFTAIAELTKNGMPASEAITAVRASLSSVLKPSKDASEAAKQMGIDFSATHLQNVGFAKFIDEIATATGGNAQKMSDLFKNVRALNGMMVLAGKGNKDYNQTLVEMNSATGATNDAFEKVESSGAAKLEAAINAIKNDGIKAGEDLMPAIAGVADKITGLANSFAAMSPEAQQTVIKIAAITAAIGPAVWAFGTLKTAWGDIKGIAGGAVGAIGNFIGGLKGAEAAADGTIPVAMKLGETIASFGAGGVGIAILALGTIATVIANIASQAAEAKPRADDLMKSLDTENASYAKLKDAQTQQESENLAEVDHVERLYGVLQKLTGANGKIIGDKQEAKIAIDEINKLFPGSIKLVDGERVAYEKDDAAIKNLIATKKAQIILDAKEPAYKKAITDVQSTAIKQSGVYNDLIQNETKLRNIQTKADQAGSNASKVLGTDWQVKTRILAETIAKEKKNYDDSNNTIKGYYGDIKNYEDLSAAITTGDQSKIQNAITNTDLTYTKATGASREQLKQQYEDANTYLSQTQQRFKQHWSGVTSDTVKQAQDLRDKAYAQYKLVGAEADNGAISGVNSKLGELKSSGVGMANSIASGLDSQQGQFSAAGRSAGDAYKNSFHDAIMKITSDINNIVTYGSTHLPNSNPGSVLTNPHLPHNASGTDDWHGGLTWLNEEGGEIVDLPQHTRIIPHDVSMQLAKSAGSGMTFTQMAKEAQASGADMMQLFAKGITTNQAIVIASVANVASGVHDYLGFSKPSKGPLANADVYMLDFMQLLSDTMNKNSDKPAAVAKKVADLVSNEIAKIKSNTTASVKGLNNQITILENQRTQAMRGNSSARVAIESEYTAKIKALRNEISSLESGSKGKGKSKGKNSAKIKELEGQISALEAAEKSAVSNISTTSKQAISDEYKAKIQAIRDKISAVKDGANKEIAEIQRVGKADKAELEQEIENRKTFVSNVNTLVDEVKEALSKEYQEAETKRETAINNDLSALDKWKTAQEDTINDVYTKKEQAIDDAATASENAIQAEINALDDETKAEDRAATHKEHEDKISDLQNQLKYSHDDYNKAQLQKQIDAEQAAYTKELNTEAVSDKKDSLQKELDAVKTDADAQKKALETEKQNELNAITNIYNKRKAALDKMLTDVKDTYSKMTSDANLEAQAEQLVMKNNQDAIIKLLNSYSDTYKMTGQTLGDKLAEGFQPAIDRITSEIANINAAISSARSDALAVETAAQAATKPAGDWKTASAKKYGSQTNNFNLQVISPVASSPAQLARRGELEAQRLFFKVSN